MNSLLSRITIEADRCGGRPCIRGFRIRVTDVLELLANGASWDEILKDYPFLEADDIRASLEFAAARVALTQAVEGIRGDSVVNGTDMVTMEEIDVEVAAVRTARRQK